MTVGFGSYHSSPTHSGMRVESFYLPMRDGVRLAVDLHLPGTLAAGEKIPALVYVTRYWRATDYRAGFGWLGASSLKPWEFLTAQGYALLTVDARGTGASFGSRRHEWDAEEVRDGGDLADWIVAQSWSNGNVGAVGTSYSGTTAELMAATGHPAVKAVLPRFNEFDPYTDIGFPGGLYLRGFVDTWSASTAALDANTMPTPRNASTIERLLLRLAVRGVKPVDADKDRGLLRQAVTEHVTNRHAADLSHDVVYRDDAAQVNGSLMRDYSVYAYRAAIERSGATIYGWGGWFDAATADAVIRRWMTVQTPQIAVIGAWNHGASQHASPYAPARADVVAHWGEFLRFFDHYLKGVETGIGAEVAARTLTYFTVGEEVWKTTNAFPPAGSRPQTWYFAAEHALAQSAPADSGQDRYTVDVDATTGTTNRWYTQLGGGAVIYPDRAGADAHLLTYTSAPLDRDIEITGYPVVTLYVTSSAEDGAFFVYLEAVEPDGKVTYLTEGELRALHRKVSPEEPPYYQPAPYHSFERRDGQPLAPGAVSEVTFGLMPISVLLRKGQRIRVAIAGADSDLFPRIPAQGAPEITIQRSPVHPSQITLPVIER